LSSACLRSVMSRVILRKPRTPPESFRRAVMTTLAQNRSRPCGPATPRPQTARWPPPRSAREPASPTPRRLAGRTGRSACRRSPPLGTP
jgi:hypothetical protein